MPEDKEDFAELRRRMVDTQLRKRGIADERVLRAMEQVPRHLFVPPSQLRSAYKDGPLPIGRGQTISQPYMVARMTEVLRPASTSKVLEIGTGSGYQAAVLAELTAEVWTVERHPLLAHRAETLLLQLGYNNIHVIVGDGSLGFPPESPYDLIIVTAAAPEVPEALRRQLAVCGRMVIPVRSGYADDCRLIERLPDGTTPDAPQGTAPRFREVSIVGCTFVPLIGEQGYQE